MIGDCAIMRIDRIDRALERCEAYCRSGEVDFEVESLLICSLLILTCSEFEKKYRDLIIERCSSVSDDSVRKYVGESTRIRSMKITELAGLLGRFGSSHREEFRRRLNENSIVMNMYDSILTNRNSVAHGEGSAASFEDVKRYYEEGHMVLDYFRDALHVPAGPAGSVGIPPADGVPPPRRSAS